MNDSSINPILLSSAAHLENVEQLIKNLEKHTLDLDNFDEILSDRNRQELITRSFSVVTSQTMAIDDPSDDNFLVKSIALTNNTSTIGGYNNENLSMDSLLNHRDLFESDVKKQQTPPANDQSLYNDQDGGFTWDDQYDTRANYRLTFSTDKPPQTESKKDRSHRHKHHHHRHRHPKHRTTDSQSSSNYSDDGLSPTAANNMNDWSMRSSFNALEQSMEQRENKTPIPPTIDQQATVVRSQSHPTSFSPQQQLPINNNSPNSSTSSSSSASWRRMKESQRTTSGMEPKETRPPSPLSLYKIFQQKSQIGTSTSSPRSAFQFYRQQSDSTVPNNIDSMTISGEKMITEKPKSSHYHKRQIHTDRPSSQTNSSTDQAIQTSIILDSSPSSQMNSRFQPTPTTNYLQTPTGSNSPHHLAVPSRPSPVPISSSSIHKSLPDLAFISQYSKELPRSRTTSPLPPTSTPPNSSLPTNTNYMIFSPTETQQQQKQESERPRTLKSIKRYKNSKHSTEPLGVFYSPQLRKTFAAVPASAVINGSNEAPTIIKMKLPPPSSFPKGQKQQTSNLKSCLKYGPRANSCDIQAMLQDRISLAPAPALTIPQPTSDRDSSSPTTKRRCSEADVPVGRPNNLWPSNIPTTGSSNDINSYVLQDFSREHRSDHDLTSLQQQNQTKKSVSFSDNIAKHLISPCNPAIKFDPAPEIHTFNNYKTSNNNHLAVALHGNQENLTKKTTLRYGDMRRCQTDIIVVDRVHHLHSFTESPPNEFRLQETDSLAPEQVDEDDQTIMEKTHVNIIPTVVESSVTPVIIDTNEINSTIEKMTSSNDKENKIPEQALIMNESTTTLIQTNDPFLDGLLEIVSGIVKRIFEIKRSGKTFFLTNENHIQFDLLLKNDLCTTLQNILEHGLKPQRKDLPLVKQITLWKIIETSIDHGQALQVFYEAKQIAQNASAYWPYKFQAFIFALLNKNELINWLYHFMKQKEILQRYYQSPDALILTFTPITFNLFDRIMAQVEKLSPLAFRLVYKPEAIPANIEEQLNTSIISMQSTKSSARDWVMTISKRPSRTLTQPIFLPNTTTNTAATATTITTTQPADSLRSTLSRKINSLFTKTNPTQPQRKTSSAVTAKLPTSKPQTVRTQSPASVVARRPRLSNVFANATAAATTNKPVIVSSPKLNNGNRTGTIRRGISPSVVVAPSPPPTLNTTGTTPTTTTAFQSKIPRPSLNVDKPKSARYRSTALPPK
ncbi:unnamed protein product [Rotaria sp. Silwood2]|nr:unnamed protein product [Rotaria sp. Silwood2]CAF2548217.1 unnamed protein product [Rotaria sp. Silwood2]CAF2799056.1 unnamed protein product [Rotaria sp. Silwood2]CAF2956892.1 unnamed protein product [Rotaria sp. Silwood2]CAF3939357.1 unnamed protein product [Rotaria sp. Silwood2]